MRRGPAFKPVVLPGLEEAFYRERHGAPLQWEGSTSEALPYNPAPEPFEAECFARDAAKGHSPAGMTMTQAEWDRRYLLSRVEGLRADVEWLLRERRLDTEGRGTYTAYVDGRACHLCGLEPYRHACPQPQPSSQNVPSSQGE